MGKKEKNPEAAAPALEAIRAEELLAAADALAAAMDACPLTITGGKDGATCAEYCDALIGALK